MAHQNRLANAHILVFGGTSGIGFAVANLALSHGAIVTISSSRQPKIDQKIEQLRSFYPNLPAANLRGVPCDLADKENLEVNLTTLFEKVTDGGKKKVDHIAFTAGDSLSLPTVKDVTPESALAGFTVRYLAPCIIAKIVAAGKYMPVSPSSSISMTGGTNTYRPFPGWAFVAAAGGANDGLVRGLAVDLKPIRVNLVIPGAIQTELLQPMLHGMGKEAADKFRADNSLTDTFGQPEDIAEAYGYLMKDRFATGSFVTCDGGRLLVTQGP